MKTSHTQTQATRPALAALNRAKEIEALLSHRQPSLMERFESLRSLERDKNQVIHEFIGAVSAHLKADPNITLADVMENFVTTGEADFMRTLALRAA